MHFLQASFHESTYHNMFVDCIAGFAIAQINSAAQTFTQAHTRTHTHIYNIHTQTHTHTHTQTHTHTHTLIQTQTNTYVYKHKHIDTHTHIQERIKDFAQGGGQILGQP